jgi:hypothetical protein
MSASNLLGRHSAYQTGEHQASHSIPPATPGINQHSPMGRLTLPPTKKQTKSWAIYKELKTNTQERDRVAESPLEKRGEARSWSHEFSVNKDWKGRRANSRWVISRCLKYSR